MDRPEIASSASMTGNTFPSPVYRCGFPRFGVDQTRSAARRCGGHLRAQLRGVHDGYDGDSGRRRHAVPRQSSPDRPRDGGAVVVQNSHESRRKYWATRSSVRSFARTAHSFACFALLASLARSAVLIISLIHSRARGKVYDSMSQIALVLSHRCNCRWPRPSSSLPPMKCCLSSPRPFPASTAPLR